MTFKPFEINAIDILTWNNQYTYSTVLIHWQIDISVNALDIRAVQSPKCYSLMSCWLYVSCFILEGVAESRVVVL
jgi:hypothetical protein